MQTHDELMDLRAWASELYTCCLNSVGAYDALKAAGVDVMLPGYASCVARLQDVLARGPEFRVKRALEEER